MIVNVVFDANDVTLDSMLTIRAALQFCKSSDKLATCLISV